LLCGDPITAVHGPIAAARRDLKQSAAGGAISAPWWRDATYTFGCASWWPCGSARAVDAPLDDFLIGIDNHLSKCAAVMPVGAPGGAPG